MEKFLNDARIYEKFLAITTIIVILDATKKLYYQNAIRYHKSIRRLAIRNMATLSFPAKE